MKKLFDSYDQAWKHIIVPERFDDFGSIGPELRQNSKGDLLKRLEFTVKNGEGLKIKGFILLNQNVPQSEYPCIIYLHSHSGNKAESAQISSFFLDHFNICSFDFSGYGSSEGEYSTLGMKEHKDLRAVVTYLRECLDIEDIYLWGRSMGAVTSILFAHHSHDIDIQGMVLDSPFTETKTMICDLIQSRASVPRFLIKTALLPIASTIKTKTNYDVLNNNPIDMAGSVGMPVYVFVAKDDVISRPERVEQMFNKFTSRQKVFEVIDGEHHTYRDDDVVLKAHQWLTSIANDRKAQKKSTNSQANSLPMLGDPNSQPTGQSHIAYAQAWAVEKPVPKPQGYSRGAVRLGGFGEGDAEIGVKEGKRTGLVLGGATVREQLEASTMEATQATVKPLDTSETDLLGAPEGITPAKAEQMAENVAANLSAPIDLNSLAAMTRVEHAPQPQEEDATVKKPRTPFEDSEEEDKEEEDKKENNNEDEEKKEEKNEENKGEERSPESEISPKQSTQEAQLEQPIDILL